MVVINSPSSASLLMELETKTLVNAAEMKRENTEVISFPFGTFGAIGSGTTKSISSKSSMTSGRAKDVGFEINDTVTGRSFSLTTNYFKDVMEENKKGNFFWKFIYLFLWIWELSFSEVDFSKLGDFVVFVIFERIEMRRRKDLYILRWRFTYIFNHLVKSIFVFLNMYIRTHIHTILFRCGPFFLHISRCSASSFKRRCCHRHCTPLNVLKLVGIYIKCDLCAALMFNSRFSLSTILVSSKICTLMD